MTSPGHRHARDARVCACECGQPLTGRRGNTRYVDERHRQRAYRNRLKREAEAKGLSPNLSLRTVRATRATRKRNGDARRRTRAPERRLSYRKACDTLAAHYVADQFMDPAVAALKARMVLSQALPGAQGAALEQREATR